MGICASKSHASILCAREIVQELNTALNVIKNYKLKLKFDSIIVELSKGDDPIIQLLGTRPRDRGTPPGLRLA